MKLIDLNPKWVVLEKDGQKVGLSFDCPHCKQQRLAVMFHRSGYEIQDDSYIHAHSPSTNHIWNATTSTGSIAFEDLSLSPSVDASASGHWHGFITRGEVQP